MEGRGCFTTVAAQAGGALPQPQHPRERRMAFQGLSANLSRWRTQRPRCSWPQSSGDPAPGRGKEPAPPTSPTASPSLGLPGIQGRPAGATCLAPSPPGPLCCLPPAAAPTGFDGRSLRSRDPHPHPGLLRGRKTPRAGNQKGHQGQVSEAGPARLCLSHMEPYFSGK